MGGDGDGGVAGGPGGAGGGRDRRIERELLQEKYGEEFSPGEKKEAVEKERPVREEKGGVLKRMLKIFGRSS